jgi:hypothetical protein
LPLQQVLPLLQHFPLLPQGDCPLPQLVEGAVSDPTSLLVPAVCAKAWSNHLAAKAETVPPRRSLIASLRLTGPARIRDISSKMFFAAIYLLLNPRCRHKRGRIV